MIISIGFVLECVFMFVIGFLVCFHNKVKKRKHMELYDKIVILSCLGIAMSFVLVILGTVY